MSKGRHRRETTLQHARGAIATVLGAALTIGLLYSVPNQPADAQSPMPMATDSATRLRIVDYGSGQLGDWQSWGHSDQTDATRPVGTVPWSVADVGIIGDSITNRCWPRLNTRLQAESATLAVNYWSGRPTTPAVDWVLQWIASGEPLPRVLVMAAGANDIYAPPVMQAQVARLKAALPSTTELLWVDVHVAKWGTSYDTAKQVSDMRNSMWVNSQIRAVLPDAQVVPWAAQVAAIPGRNIALSYYLQDGVHPWAAAGTTPYSHGDGCDLWAYTVMGKVGPLL